MIHHFDCPHVMPHIDDQIVIDWDDDTGEITGPSAEEVLAEFKAGVVSAHPIPSSHVLASTKNRTDMAAVIGWNHRLPPELADHYPQVDEDADLDGAIYDEAGNVVGYVQF